MFELTVAAAEAIRRAAQDPKGEGPLKLRVAAKIEDGEIVYGMGFDDIREHDAVIECHGVTILIAPRSQPLLAGAKLDFVEVHAGEYQFVFFNPNEPAAAGCASRTGGCGPCSGERCAS
ncbi:MAG: hypothetical protein N2441_02710 [Rhodocyclaceae bacterium]|nr:hypothetical protein [Rhodocyclaceae bacterium]